MKFVLLIALASSPNLFACGGDYLDPDGDNIFFYEECLHMNRGKFTDELHQKCAEYSKNKLLKII